MDTARSNWAAATLCTAVSGVCSYFGSGLHPIWWLMWLAAIPVLWLSTQVTARVAFATSFVALAVGGLNMWRYLHGILRLPAGPCIASVVVPAVFFAVFVLFFRSLTLRGRLISAVLVFPAAWVTYEYVSNLLSPHGTFGSIAYTQMNFLPILQVASVTGIWGISFCMMLFAAAIAVLAKSGGPRTPGVAIVVSFVLIAVLGFGEVRLHVLRSPTPDTKVGLVASDLPENILAETPREASRLLGQYAEQARAFAAQGAQAVVIPEKLAVTPDSQIGEIDSLFGSVARDTKAWIVVGLIHPTSKAKWNEARVYSPSGAVAASYGKHHMLPPYESSFTIGRTRTLLPQPQSTWGVTICKDMDFTRLSREYGNDGAGLLLVPAWDFTADGWLHGRMAVMRGIESGFSIARAPKQGILTVTDDRGRVLAERDSSAQPFTTLIAEVPSRHQDTIYERLGDWFAWACVALLALIGIAEFRTGRINASRQANRTKMTALAP